MMKYNMSKKVMKAISYLPHLFNPDLPEIRILAQRSCGRYDFTPRFILDSEYNSGNLFCD